MGVEDQTAGMTVMQMTYECDLEQCDDLEVFKKKDQSDSNMI